MKKENFDEKTNAPSKKKDDGVGPIAASIIIIFIIIVGAFYLFSLVKERTQPQDDVSEELIVDRGPSSEELLEQSDSDEISDIEADLEAEDFSDLGAELEDIEKEFDSI
jgi:flagellar biosynthesis/type III secretory pathway M-ring protein FliF/YscJ